MRILAIETSCDETSAAVVEKKSDNYPVVISSRIASSSDLHSITGGIIPEQAAREQLQYMIPIILQALLESQNEEFIDLPSAFKRGKAILTQSIDAIAVTQGPGLIGSLLVGVETAKTLAYTCNKPLIPVNHLLAHLYANWLIADGSPQVENIVNNHTQRAISFPFIGLIVSGGHTDLLYFEDHGKYQWIGGTRDDAAGEALDKIGRLLGLPYPAGPEIEKQARNATHKSITFSRALKNSQDFDFSFSGLKTEAARFIQKQHPISEKDISEICFAVQDAVTDILVFKTYKAAMRYNADTILLGGGVSANDALKDTFKTENLKQKMKPNVIFPDKKYTTDNAAMVGAYAAYNYIPVDWRQIKASPELHLV